MSSAVSAKLGLLPSLESAKASSAAVFSSDSRLHSLPSAKERKDLTAEYLPACSGGWQPPPCTSAHWLTHVRLVWSRSAAMEMRVTLPLSPPSPPMLSFWKAFSIVWQSERKLPPLVCIWYFWMLLVSWWSTLCRMMTHAGGECGSFSERRAAAEHHISSWPQSHWYSCCTRATCSSSSWYQSRKVLERMAAWLSIMGESYSVALPQVLAWSWLSALYHWLPQLNMLPPTSEAGTRMVGCAMSGRALRMERKRPCTSAPAKEMSPSMVKM
mmetsp:Transcript_40731/g.97680  ORF Transcript_40731/g.97680 Transcript_40731/m.97680 type:complete len:270 (-) Transcript_40731:1761-2570(-)